MKLLFVAKYYPAEFKHILYYTVRTKEYEIQYFSEYRNQQFSTRGLSHTSVKFPRIHYKGSISEKTAVSLLRRADSFKNSLLRLKESGFMPNLIFLEASSACALHIRDVFPDVPCVAYCDWYFNKGSEFDMLQGVNNEDKNDFSPLRIRNMFQLDILNNCNKAFTYTQWQKDSFPAAIQKKISVIPAGVNTYFYKAGDKETSRKYFNLNENDEVITYATPVIKPHDSLMVLFGAIKKILNTRKTVQFLMVGKVINDSSEDNAENENFITKYFSEYKDRIVILENPTSHSYKVALNSSDLHVHTAMPTLLASTLPEAMSCSCLILAEHAPAVEECVTDNETGFLNSFDNVDSLSTKIIDLLDNRNSHEAVREQARKKACASFSILSSLKKIKKMINSI